jgi:hypothetical protein
MHTIIARKERLLAAILLFALGLAPSAWAYGPILETRIVNRK